MSVKMINFNQILDDWRGFTHLCNRLIKTSDPKARVYLKEGKDYGIDARSGDGKTNYQFKFHQKFQSVLSELTAQVQQIKKHKADGKTGEQLWSGVTSYHVMTSADTLPQWEDKLVPAYKEIGIALTIESGEDLRLRIEKFPELHQWFWEGKARFFYQLDEQMEYFEDSLGSVGKSTLKIGYSGRENELQKFDEFAASNDPVLLVLGPAGSGKSRFLIEAGSKAESAGWNVLFADSDQSLTDSIFSRISKIDKTILFLDEPRNPDRLKDLIVQLRRDRSLKENWRIVIGLRTHIDGVTKTINQVLPGKKKEIKLEPIDKKHFTPFVESLLRQSGIDVGLAKQIEKISGGIPVWAVLACEAVVKGLAPANVTREEIISFKLDQICNEVIESLTKLNLPKDSVQEVVRRVATFEPINAEDSDDLKLLADQSKVISESQVKQVLQLLVDKHFCRRRGRLVRVQPEIVRDYIVAAWFAPNGQPSGIHSNLIKATPKHIDRLINAVGRTEYIYSNKIDLLGQTCSELKEELKTLPNSKRYSVLKGTEPLSIWRPLDFADFCRVSLNHPQQEEVLKLKFFDEDVDQKFSHDELIKQMAWPLYHSAMYSRNDTDLEYILDTLKLVHRIEHKLELANDGKRVRDVAPRFVKWGTVGTPVIQELCLKYCIDRFNKLPLAATTSSEFDEADLVYLKFFLQELIKTEFRYEEWDDLTISFSQWDMQPKGKEFDLRTQAKNFVLDVASRAKWRSARVAGWALIDEVIRSENQLIRSKKGKDPSVWRAEVKRSLEALPSLLADEEDPTVLSAARRAWNWTIRFSTDKELKDLSKQADATVSNKSSLSYVNILNKGEKGLGPSDEAVAELVKILSAEIKNGKVNELIKAVDQIQAYQGEQYLLGAISHILFTISVELPNEVHTMALALQSELEEKHQSYVGATLRGLRVANGVTRDASHKLFMTTWADLQSKAKSQQALVNIVSGIYPTPFHPKVNKRFDQYDFDFLCPFILEALKSNNDFIPYFCHLCALILDYDTHKGLALAKDLISKADTKNSFKSFSSFISGIHYVRLFEEDLIKRETFEEILNLLITIPDIGRFNSDADWELQELSKKVGGVSLDWLVKFFNSRDKHFQAMSKEEQEAQKYQIVSSSFKIWKMVRVDELVETDATISDATKKLIEEILLWGERRDMLGYITPNIIKSIDPHGRAAPDMIKRKIEGCDLQGDAKNLLCWARYVGFYFHSEMIWSPLAVAVMRKIKDFDRDSQRSLYHYLTDTKPQVYSGVPGEVPSALIGKRDFYQEKLASLRPELSELKDFYEWGLRVAEADIEFEKQHDEERRFE